uniref:Triple gene block protein 3 n=1 Tax=Mesocestoides corti TaxID=53468 RepID=A0A5K3FIJ8_MESCO
MLVHPQREPTTKEPGKPINSHASFVASLMVTDASRNTVDNDDNSPAQEDNTWPNHCCRVCQSCCRSKHCSDFLKSTFRHLSNGTSLDQHGISPDNYTVPVSCNLQLPGVRRSDSHHGRCVTIWLVTEFTERHIHVFLLDLQA